MRTFKRELWCDLTHLELEAISQEMSAHVLTLEKVEAEKKSANEAYKERMDTLKRQIKEAATQINTGRVERPVDCYKEMDYEHNVTRVIRADTHEVIEERAMTTEERQRCFEAPEAGEVPGAQHPELQ